MLPFQAIRRAYSTEAIKEILKSVKDGFDNVLQKVNIIKAENGNCLAELKLEREHTNFRKGLHGGLSSTLVDSITTYALYTHKNAKLLPTVSVDLHLTFMKGGQMGDEIVIDAKTLRAGKTLAFLTCEIRNKQTGDVLVQGSHTKFIMQPKK